MPAMVASDLKSPYNDAWKDLEGKASVKAESLANEFAKVIETEFGKVKFNYSVTGMIGTIPYSGTEMVAGSFDTSSLKSEIKAGYTDLWQQASKNSLLSQYINTESKFIAKAIENFFTQAIYQPKVHSGSPISRGPLQATVIEATLKGQLSSIYTIDKIGITSVKAQNMGMAIQSAIAAAIPMVIGSGAVSSPPTGAGVGPLV